MNTKRVITEQDNVHREWYLTAKTMHLAELPEFLRHLIKDYHHDYGTICHALAAAALAAAQALNHDPAGGITGFQAGAVMWEFITHWNYREEDHLVLQNYSNMLYPQHRDDFTTLSSKTWAWLQEEARNKLASEESEGLVAPAVLAHWRSIVAGEVPFGYTVLP